MLHRLVGLCLTLLLFACDSSSPDTQQLVGELPSDPQLKQQAIIAHLSGETPLADGSLLPARWSKAERKLTRRYLQDLLPTIGLEPQVQAYTQPNVNVAIDLILEPFRGKNIYGVLPATNGSEEYVVLGAHYDTGRPGAPGANDDATGMTLIYTVVAELAQLAERKKNVIIVFFDQEEEELVGSTAFAELLLQKDWPVHSVHTFDMLGWDSDGNREMELEMPQAEIEALYQRHADQMGIPIYVTQISSSDHYSFIRKGFSAVGVSEAYAKRDSTPFKDTTEDTYDTVNFDFLWSATQFVTSVITEIVQS